MTRGLAAWTPVALLSWSCALAVACGPGVEEGPVPAADVDSDTDTDTDVDTDTDTGTETEAATCPATPLSSCGDAPEPAHLELAAVSVEPGLVFVDADDRTVLARRTVAGVPAPIVIAGDVDGEGGEPLDAFWRADLAGYDGVPVEPIAVAAGLEAPFDSGGARALLLVRTPAGNALFRTDVHVGINGGITAVPGGELPSAGELRGLVYLRRKVIDSSPFETDPEFNRVCAFGDGLFCFDGEGWETEIPPGAGTPLNAVAVIDSGDAAHIVAVGDDGRVAVEADGGWQELDLGVDVDLRAASAHSGRFTAAGGKGVVVDGTLDGQLVCQTYDWAFASLGWRIGQPYGSEDSDEENDADMFVALTADGAIVHGAVGDGPGWMCDSGDAIPGATVGRMIDVDYYILTPAALYVRYYGSGAVIE